MATLTLRLSDKSHESLRQIAKQEHVSLNKLFDKITSELILNYQLEQEFKVRAKRGVAYRAKAMTMLDKLDKLYGTPFQEDR